MFEVSDELLPVAAALLRSRNSVVEARRNVDVLWSVYVDDVCAAHEAGLSLEKIASICGVSKARIWQIVSKER